MVSMAIIPVMIKFAPRLGMVDLPDARKVHAVPVPRVGGVGVFLGAIIALLIFLPMDKVLLSYLSGAVVLFIFGVWDDSHELGHYVKFIGQFAAAIAVVYGGELWVSAAPFLSQPLPGYIGKPFTIIAIVGVINAINHSDGLDGLAGGESLLSLGCIAYLAATAGSLTLVITVCAVIGGVFGFLRFNTHPARVFMGDSGSQFLGFSLSVFVIWLTQRVNPGLSMALPMLILGLPIIDIIAVFIQRIYGGMNWFRATKNHIHHRLLDRGFDHHEAVLIIYSVHGFLVLSAIFLSYESDWLVAGIYLGVCMMVFAALIFGERNGWRIERSARTAGLLTVRNSLRSTAWLVNVPKLFVKISIPIYFIFGGMLIEEVPQGFIGILLVIASTLAVLFVAKNTLIYRYLLRFSIYAAAAIWVYLSSNYYGPAGQLSAIFGVAYFGLLLVSIALVMRFSGETEFRATTMDFLMVVMIVAASVLSRWVWNAYDLGRLIVEVAILFYGCELILSRESVRWSGVLSFSVMAALGLVGQRLLM